MIFLEKNSTIATMINYRKRDMGDKWNFNFYAFVWRFSGYSSLWSPTHLP